MFPVIFRIFQCLVVRGQLSIYLHLLLVSWFWCRRSGGRLNIDNSPMLLLNSTIRGSLLNHWPTNRYEAFVEYMNFEVGHSTLTRKRHSL